MHRHYGMTLETVGHAHNGADGPTHGPHTHDREGLGAVVTLARLFEEASERTDDEELNAAAEIRQALIGLLRFCIEGGQRYETKNPYCIPEVKAGLQALGKAVDPAVNWLDLDLKALSL